MKPKRKASRDAPRDVYAALTKRCNVAHMERDAKHFVKHFCWRTPSHRGRHACICGERWQIAPRTSGDAVDARDDATGTA